VFAVQLHEVRAGDAPPRHELAAFVFEPAHVLAPTRADRLNQAPAPSELLRQRWRHVRERGGDDDRIERRLLGQPARPVADQQRWRS
jgi:hypothetical protein